MVDSKDFKSDLVSLFAAASENQNTIIVRIRNKLERQLPFYECNEEACLRKSDAQIRSFFLDFRWQLGSEYVSEQLLTSLKQGGTNEE